MENDSAIRFGEWLTIGATLLGPILAIQAQKWLERRQRKQAVKDGIFRTLMSTRATRLAPEHVQALNMIDIAFYGRRWLGRQRQSDAESRVCTARRSYFDALNTNLGLNPTEAQRHQWGHVRDEKFFALLEAIAQAQDFHLDPTELRRAVYLPVGHSAIENEQDTIRSGLAKLLSGEIALSMRVVNLPDQQNR
jgi:hypothetical protein